MADCNSLARADALTTHPSAVLELEPRTFVEVDWLGAGVVRHLRRRFLLLARQARRTDYPMFHPYLRIARDYRNQLKQLESSQ